MSRKSNTKVKIVRSTMANGEYHKAGSTPSLRASDARLLLKMGKAVSLDAPAEETKSEKVDDFKTVEELQDELDSLEEQLEKASASKAKNAAAKVAKLEAKIEEIESLIAEA